MKFIEIKHEEEHVKLEYKRIIAVWSGIEEEDTEATCFSMLVNDSHNGASKNTVEYVFPIPFSVVNQKMDEFEENLTKL